MSLTKNADRYDIESLSQREYHAVVEAELRRRSRISIAKTGVPRDAETRDKISLGRRRYLAEQRAEKAAATADSLIPALVLDLEQ
jgi:hypothetical protein